MMGVQIENQPMMPSGLKRALQHAGPVAIDVVTIPSCGFVTVPIFRPRRSWWFSG